MANKFNTIRAKQLNNQLNQFMIYDWHPQFNMTYFQSSDDEICEYRVWNKWDEETESNIHTYDSLILIDGMWDSSDLIRDNFKYFINNHTSFTYVNRVQWRKEIQQNKYIKNRGY